jgi:multidrug resistance efflux pump
VNLLRRFKALPTAIVTVIAVVLMGVAALWSRTDAGAALSAEATRGPLTVVLTTAGTLKPTESLTYRSPVIGRELEIAALAPEGSRVKAGDLLVRLNTNELQRDADRARQELRQLKLDLQLAHGERQDAEALVQSVTEGEGVLAVEEARTRLQLAQLKAERLRSEFEEYKPLMQKGFITREELARTESESTQANEELTLARRRAEIVEKMAHPRERQRAALQLAQKTSQLEHIVGRVQEAELRQNELSALIDQSAIYARGPGLVVYEELLNASPRRKIRIGDRVTPTQGLITIPDVARMIVESSVSEAELHRVKPGQAAVVRLEAYPDLRLNGKVARVGTLATSSSAQGLDDKRFDLVIELSASTADLRPEMTARADIVVDAKESVLRVPVAAVFQRNGAFIVYMANGETRSVDIGEANEEFVEVVSGIAEGERVLLTDAERAETGGAAPKGAAPGREGNSGTKPF